MERLKNLALLLRNESFQRISELYLSFCLQKENKFYFFIANILPIIKVKEL